MNMICLLYTSSDIRHNIREIKKYIPKLAAQITLSKEGIPHLVDAVQELWDMGINMVYSNLVFGEEVNYTYEEYATCLLYTSRCV